MRSRIYSVTSKEWDTPKPLTWTIFIRAGLSKCEIVVEFIIVTSFQIGLEKFVDLTDDLVWGGGILDIEGTIN